MKFIKFIRFKVQLQVFTSSDTWVWSLPIQVEREGLNWPFLKLIGVILASKFKCAPKFLNLNPVITWPEVKSVSSFNPYFDFPPILLTDLLKFMKIFKFWNQQFVLFLTLCTTSNLNRYLLTLAFFSYTKVGVSRWPFSNRVKKLQKA